VPGPKSRHWPAKRRERRCRFRRSRGRDASRICLIIPPSAFLLDERVFVSVGTLKIAAVLVQAAHEVRLLDLSGIKNHRDALVVRPASSDDARKSLGIAFNPSRAALRFEHTMGRGLPGFILKTSTPALSLNKS
jgi:hypothetical protein